MSIWISHDESKVTERKKKIAKNNNNKKNPTSNVVMRSNKLGLTSCITIDTATIKSESFDLELSMLKE